MRPKNYMRRYQATVEEARETIEKIQWLESQKTTLQQIVDGMPHGKGASDSDVRLESLIMKVDKLKAESADELERLIENRLEIEKVIREIPDPRYKRVLYSKYIELKTWEQIAEEMDYSYQWVCELHGYALSEVGKVIAKLP